MTFVSNTVETGLTRLTEALLAKEPLDAEALADHMAD